MLRVKKEKKKKHNMNLFFVRCAVLIHSLDHFWCNETLNCAYTPRGLEFKSKQKQYYFNRNRIKTNDDTPFNIFFNVLELKTFCVFAYQTFQSNNQTIAVCELLFFFFFFIFVKSILLSCYYILLRSKVELRPSNNHS